MIRRKLKRTTKHYILVAFTCILVIGGVAIGTVLVITGQIRDKYMGLLSIANQKIADNQRSIYVAQSDITAGDFITKDNAAIQVVFTEQPEGEYITEEDLGKVAIIDIKMGTQLLKGMLSGNKVSKELREMEYSVINISSNIGNQDSVDVRIGYPNGETYVVLSKKLIRGYVPETSTCNFWLDEEELLRMSAAIVDAALYPGSSIYVTKYIEPNIQEASIVNYTPSLSVLSLLETDPNILERASQELSRKVRMALENRLADSMETKVSQINWNVDPYLPYMSRDTNTSMPEEGMETEGQTDKEAQGNSSLSNDENIDTVEESRLDMVNQVETPEKEQLKKNRVFSIPDESELGQISPMEGSEKAMFEEKEVLVGGNEIVDGGIISLDKEEQIEAELDLEYFMVGG